MAIKKPIPITFNLDSHNSVQSVCAVIHIDDKNTETLDLSLMQGGEHIAVSSNSTVTARFVRVKDKILISDNVPCAVQENGNIYIPIDNAAAHMLVDEIKIEVNIVDENDILTMQFPLVIKVNNTILADAEISPESEGTIPELLEEAKEAAESAAQAAEAATEAISTKQDKLTAGKNITIDDNNVISAEGGGVTSYDDLTDKPTVEVNGSQIVPLSGKLTFTTGFSLKNYLPGELIRVDLQDVPRSALESGQNYLSGKQVPSDNHFTAQYDFNNLRNPQAVGEVDYTDAGFFKCIGKCLLNTPQIFSSSIGDNSRVMIIHFNTIPINDQYHYLLRVIYFQDSSTNKIRQFAQWIYYKSKKNATVHNVTDWCEIGGGSQIVSGVVNANGTITFEDSGGNTFTTSGSNLVTSDNEQISMGYDEDGFYFLFDDGQEEVNNGTD